MLVDRPVDVDDVGMPLTTVTTTLEAVTTPIDAVDVDSAKLSDVVVLLAGVCLLETGVEIALVESSEAVESSNAVELALSEEIGEAEEADELLIMVAFGLGPRSPPSVAAVGDAKVWVSELSGAR